MAKWISSALVRMPSVSIIWYLWNSTVRAEIPSLAAISFAERPSARSWRTSRCLERQAGDGVPGTFR